MSLFAEASLPVCINVCEYVRFGHGVQTHIANPSNHQVTTKWLSGCLAACLTQTFTKRLAPQWSGVKKKWNTHQQERWLAKSVNLLLFRLQIANVLSGYSIPLLLGSSKQKRQKNCSDVRKFCTSDALCHRGEVTGGVGYCERVSKAGYALRKKRIMCLLSFCHLSLVALLVVFCCVLKPLFIPVWCPHFLTEFYGALIKSCTFCALLLSPEYWARTCFAIPKMNCRPGAPMRTLIQT